MKERMITIAGALLGVLLGIAICLKLTAPHTPRDIRTGELQIIFEGSYPFAGDTARYIYHRLECAYLPERSQRVYFSSEDDAIFNEYTPCTHCCADKQPS